MAFLCLFRSEVNVRLAAEHKWFCPIVRICGLSLRLTSLGVQARGVCCDVAGGSWLPDAP